MDSGHSTFNVRTGLDAAQEGNLCETLYVLIYKDTNIETRNNSNKSPTGCNNFPVYYPDVKMVDTHTYHNTRC